MKFAICDDMPIFLLQLNEMIRGIYSYNSVSLKNGEAIPLSGKYRKNVEHEYVSRLWEMY